MNLSENYPENWRKRFGFFKIIPYLCARVLNILLCKNKKIMNDTVIAKPANPASKERNLSIDILKLLLALTIVCAHCGLFKTFPPLICFLVLNGFSRIIVPVFLLISGFYFYKVQSQKQFITWIKRLFILYILWTLIYTPLWIRPNFKFIIDIIDGYNHLWYLIGAVEAIIILWFLRNLKIQNLLIITILCALSGLFLQYNYNYRFTEIFNLLYNFVNNASYRNGLFFCFPFIVIGYLYMFQI